MRKGIGKVYYLLGGDEPVSFEFDEAKSRANKDKHGIDFVEAQTLWLDPRRTRTAARSLDEDRFLVIGRIGERYWSAFVTYRGDRVRLISVRRSRREEVAIYGRRGTRPQVRQR